MKNFLINTLKFFIIPVITIIILVSSYFIIVNNISFWKLPHNEEHIVCAHSLPQCAFNDGLIDNFVNISASGELYFFTYTKLKKVIASNPQIKTIFIGFSREYILTQHGNIQNETVVNNWVPRYFPIMDLSELKILYDSNLSECLHIPPRFIFKSMLYSYYNLILNNNNFIGKALMYGGYRNLTNNLNDSLVANAMDRLKKNKSAEISIDEFNLSYLSKILELCSENKITAYLVQCPVHEAAYSVKEREVLKEIRNNRFSNIEFLDFERFPLKNDEYADCYHLNYKGSNKFSLWFVGLLDENLLEKNNKQRFIEKEILLLQ